MTTTTAAIKRKYNKKLGKSDISFKDLQSVVEYLEPKFVKRIKIGDLELEFDPMAAVLAKKATQEFDSLDDEEVANKKKVRNIEDLIKEGAADQEKDMFWSASR